MRRLLRYGYAAIGWLLVYLAVGGALGFAVTRPHQAGPSCVPFLSMFGAIETTCSNEWANLLWFIAIGIPRLLIIPSGLMFALLKAGFIARDGRMALDAIPFVLASIPVLLLIWCGRNYWWNRQRVVAWIATMSIVLEIALLGSLA